MLIALRLGGLGGDASMYAHEQVIKYSRRGVLPAGLPACLALLPPVFWPRSTWDCSIQNIASRLLCLLLSVSPSPTSTHCASFRMIYIHIRICYLTSLPPFPLLSHLPRILVYLPITNRPPSSTHRVSRDFCPGRSVYPGLYRWLCPQLFPIDHGHDHDRDCCCCC